MALSTNNICRFLVSFYLGVTLTAAFSNQNVAFHATRSSASALRARITTYLDDGNYDKIMLGDDKVVLAMACAKWCGPCKLIEPFVVESAEAHALDVVKFDVEAKNNGSVKVEFLLQGVMPRALPSLVLFRNGKQIASHTGALKQEEVDEFLQSNLPESAKDETRELASDSTEKGGKGFISFGGMRDNYALS